MLLNKRIPIWYTVKKVWAEMVLVTVMSVVIVYIDRNFNSRLGDLGLVRV